jgi:hypothetical protein
VIGAAAMSGTASAGSSQVGTIGDPSNLVTTSETTDYEVQKDGSDTSGVINFKTS